MTPKVVRAFTAFLFTRKSVILEEWQLWMSEKHYCKKWACCPPTIAQRCFTSLKPWKRSKNRRHRKRCFYRNRHCRRIGTPKRKTMRGQLCERGHCAHSVSIFQFIGKQAETGTCHCRPCRWRYDFVPNHKRCPKWQLRRADWHGGLWIRNIAGKKFRPPEQDFYRCLAVGTLLCVPIGIRKNADNHGGNRQNLGKITRWTLPPVLPLYRVGKGVFPARGYRAITEGVSGSG